MGGFGKRLHNIIYGEHITPLNPRVLIPLFIILVGEMLSMSVMFSYLPAMIKDFGFKDIDVGTYAGIAASTLFIGKMFGSFIWGLSTDRLGRRKTILLSCLLQSVSGILVGINWHYVWILCARFLQGLVGGMIVPAKVIAAEICDATNQGLGMGSVMSGYTVGVIIGPTIGGLLSQPQLKYPEVFSKDSLFAKFPYLLPNIIGVGVLMIGLVLVYIYLPETRRPDKSTKPIQHPEMPDTWDEKKTAIRNVNGTGKRLSLLQLLRIKEIMLGLMLYGLISFIAVSYREIIPIFAATPREYGGLSFSTTKIGFLALAQGIPSLCVVLFIAPKLEYIFGAKKLLLLSLFQYMFLIMLIPTVAKIKEGPLLWVVLISWLSCMQGPFFSAYLCVAVLINNSISLEYTGIVNGFGMSVASAFRAVAPAVIGSLYSWSLSENSGFPLNISFIFFILSIVSFLLILVTVKVPKHMDYKWQSGEQQPCLAGYTGTSHGATQTTEA